MNKNLKTRMFLNDEGGSITVMNIYFTIVLCILAGIAIDMASLVQARTQLQVAADAAAHAALVTRETAPDNTSSKDVALAVAKANIPSRLGVTLERDDILFGTYDRATRKFTVDDEDSKDAVYVMTERALADANPVSSFLLQFIGFDNFDVRTAAVYETYIPACFREGFVAHSRVDVQSLNEYKDGFCIHSNSHVEVNQNNVFETGVIVSMPNPADLVVPANKMDKNEGLDKALRSSKYNIKILGRLDDIKAGVTNPSSDYYRDFLSSTTYITDSISKSTTMTMADFTEFRAHRINCTGKNSDLTLNGSFANIVLVTDCAIKFGNAAEVVNATIITEDQSANSWQTPQGLTLGANDNCGDGGSAQLLSYGSVSSAAKLTIYGSQIIVAGSIDFAAGAEGQGAAVVAGGQIDGTSGMNMAYCGKGMGDNFTAEYFRLAG